MKKQCTLKGCKKVSELKRGLCSLHYQRLLHHGDVHHVFIRKKNVCSVENCNNFAYGFGYCDKHYQRFRKYKTTDLPKRQTTEERFYSRFRIGKPDECWTWNSTHNGLGYGFISINNKHRLAHRLSWEIFKKQEIPPTVCCLHKCDNPSCVNPNHLFLGSKKDNTQDMVKKGRNNNQFGIRVR